MSIILDITRSHTDDAFLFREQIFQVANFKHGVRSDVFLAMFTWTRLDEIRVSGDAQNVFAITIVGTVLKDHKSADVRRQLGDLGTKINQQMQPVFTSKRIANHLRVTEEKPPLINIKV